FLQPRCNGLSLWLCRSHRRHALEQRGGHATPESHVLREELQDSDADHAWHDRLSCAVQQRIGAVWRLASHERPVAPGDFPERESFGEFTAEFNLLVLRVPEMAGAASRNARADEAWFRQGRVIP